MKKFSIVIFLVALLFLSYNAYAAASQADKSFSGSFTGSNSPTIPVGGNCPPINVKMNITGVCEGANSINYGCGPATTVTGIYGNFLRHDANVSAKGACSVGNCTAWLNDTVSTLCLNTTKTLLNGTSLIANCNSTITAESVTVLGGYNSSCKYGGGCDTFKCNITTYYAPCTRDPQATVNGTVWKYSGMLNNTSTTSINIGTNSNPSLKTVPGNLQLGNNLLSLSATNLNKFNYTVTWTEETVTGGSDKDGDGYYDSQCTLGNDCDDNDPNVYPGHAEVPDNRKDDNCDGVGDDLTIASMADITAKCPYNSDTKTYDCTGWENIYITSDITLPSVDCSYQRACRRDGNLQQCTPTKIIFQADNRFSAGNFYATNSGGNGGSINIDAKTITATSLNTYGSGCRSSNCDCGGPFCSSNYGGPITLKGDSITVTTLNANDGDGAGSGGGTVTVTGNTVNVNNIYSSGGYYGGCYGSGGSGGAVIVKSNTASISTILLNGGQGDNDYGHGGNGGSAKISADSLTLGSVSSNGDYAGGSGGSTKIYADTYTIGSITEKGATGRHSSNYGWSAHSGNGGFIALFSDRDYSADAVNFDASGGSTPYCNSCNGCCWTEYGANGVIKIGKRTGSGFFIFETNLTSLTTGSYELKIKNTSNENVKALNNEDFVQYGKIKNRYMTAAIGWVNKLNLKLGKDYKLNIMASNESFFNISRCGIGAQCSNYTIPFVKY